MLKDGESPKIRDECRWKNDDITMNVTKDNIILFRFKLSILRISFL